MEENLEEKNPVAEKILNEIDPAVRKTFSQEQLTAIRTSIHQNLPLKKKHSLDVRGTIPLFFRRIYFVFSSGKDERKKDENDVRSELRAKAAVKGAMTLLASMLLVLCVFGALLLGYLAPLLYG